MSVEQHPPDVASETPPLHLGRAVVNLARDLVIAVVIGVGLFLAVRGSLQHTLVQGPSMEPNYHHGQRVLVNTLALRMGPLARGDVVVFRFKFRLDDDPYIKRVVGLPGEEVEVRSGVVWVDGQALDEPWPTLRAAYSARPVRLGAEEYYVLGDNRANSSDSHVWGPQPADLITGKVWITIWPPADWPVVGRFLGRWSRGS